MGYQAPLRGLPGSGESCTCWPRRGVEDFCSMSLAFFISASIFAAMSLYGYTTKKDLSGFGTFLIMGVIGLIVARS